MRPEPQRNQKIAGQQLTVDRIPVAVAVILSIPTGWWLADVSQLAGSGVARTIAAILAPILLASLILGSEVFRSVITQRQEVEASRRLVGPFGSINSGYILGDTPGSEFRRESLLIGALFAAGIVLLLPALFVDPSLAPASLLPLPGLVILGFSMLSLVPALPMPGGHVLRAIFWFLLDRHSSGTRAAFLYSQLTASAAFGFGGFFLIAQPWLLIPALWCLLGGACALRASREELRRSIIMERAQRVRGADALAGLNPTVRAAAPLSEAIDILMEQHQNGPALVRDRNVYIGMLSLQLARSVPRREWATTQSREKVIDFAQLADSNPGEDLLGVLQRLDRGMQDAVVVRETTGAIVGLVDRSMDARRLLRRGLSRTISGTEPLTSKDED